MLNNSLKEVDGKQARTDQIVKSKQNQFRNMKTNMQLGGKAPSALQQSNSQIQLTNPSAQPQNTDHKVSFFAQAPNIQTSNLSLGAAQQQPLLKAAATSQPATKIQSIQPVVQI